MTMYLTRKREQNTASRTLRDTTKLRLQQPRMITKQTRMRRRPQRIHKHECNGNAPNGNEAATKERRPTRLRRTERTDIEKQQTWRTTRKLRETNGSYEDATKNHTNELVERQPLSFILHTLKDPNGSTHHDTDHRRDRNHDTDPRRARRKLRIDDASRQGNDELPRYTQYHRGSRLAHQPDRSHHIRRVTSGQNDERPPGDEGPDGMLHDHEYFRSLRAASLPSSRR